MRASVLLALTVWVSITRPGEYPGSRPCLLYQGRWVLFRKAARWHTKLIGTAEIRGLHYSKAFSYGNAIDFNECDYLEYLSQDDETKLIMMYIEGVRDGKRFLEILRKTTAEETGYHSQRRQRQIGHQSNCFSHRFIGRFHGSLEYGDETGRSYQCRSS